MRLVRVAHGQGSSFAALCDDSSSFRLWSSAPWSGGDETSETVPAAEVRLLAPVLPSKIVCVGRSYRAHASELGNEVPDEPLLFLKPPSALLADGERIELPPQSERVEHEGELGVVLGGRLRDASEHEAQDAIFGLTCVNDVTARDLQRRDVQFTRAKGFDTFCPCGPWIVTGVDPADLSIVVRVSGEVRQDGRTADLIWPVPELLARISAVMTLEAGDLVCTGTPAGVGPLRAGDEVTVEVESVGRLTNAVGPRRTRS